MANWYGYFLINYTIYVKKCKNDEESMKNVNKEFVKSVYGPIVKDYKSEAEKIVFDHYKHKIDFFLRYQ